MVLAPLPFEAGRGSFEDIVELRKWVAEEFLKVHSLVGHLADMARHTAVTRKLVRGMYVPTCMMRVVLLVSLLHTRM